MPEHYKEPAAVVPDTEAAIVTASNMTDLELVLPSTGDIGELPEAARFLAACAMRYHADPAFVDAQLKWLEKHKGDRS